MDTRGQKRRWGQAGPAEGPPPGWPGVWQADVGGVWQAVVDNINAFPQALQRGDRVVEALADQLRRDVVIRDRDAERTRWERAVPLCDGSQDCRLREWISEVDGVPAELRREVADRNAQGPLAASIREYIEHNPGGGWEVLRGTLAREYFSQEYAASMQDDLQRVERKPHEQLTNFLPRLRPLADLAYPPRMPSPEAGEIIVRSLAGR